MKWNKLYLRKMTEEEKEDYGDKVEYMWDGVLPEVGQYVIVKQSKNDEPVVDRWEDDGNGLGFYHYYDTEDCYWVPVPEFEV